VAGVSRRWLLVGAGAVALVGVTQLPEPAPVARIADAIELRRRIGAQAVPYVGYAESTAQLGLPEIPQLASVVMLLTGTTRIRANVAAPDRWRVDEVLIGGERDTYRLGGTEYLWDFVANQATRVTGVAAFRLPRAGDLLPPDLARRLLALAPDDPVTALPARRVAGRDAVGLRLTPSDPQTTVGRVDVWADPRSALPLRVEVAPRTGPTVLTTEFLELDERAPDPVVLRPPAPAGANKVTTRAVDLSGALRVLNPPPPPDVLAGRRRTEQEGEQLAGVGVYGSGLAAFALVPCGRDIADQAVANAAVVGGTPVEVPSGTAAVVGTALLSVGVRTRGRTGSLLVGAVPPDVLRQALVDLPSRRRT
jgi:hypothetical protein